jgi:hypothetical protein
LKITIITQDESGLIWFGTLGVGLAEFDPTNARFGWMQHKIVQYGEFYFITLRLK